MERIKYTLYDYHLFNETTGEEFHLDGPINGEELHNKGPIRSNEMLNFKYLFDYPEGFTLEDCKTILDLVAKEDDPFSVMRMVFPQYYIQVSFCDNGDLIFHISEKKNYGRTLVKYLRYVDYDG